MLDSCVYRLNGNSIPSGYLCIQKVIFFIVQDSLVVLVETPLSLMAEVEVPRREQDQWTVSVGPPHQRVADGGYHINRGHAESSEHDEPVKPTDACVLAFHSLHPLVHLFLMLLPCFFCLGLFPPT
ncbi:hypothetical protein BHM03_00008559 [Ensete ventricosum]|nr:hypothetical protein BHM03_00008559 [Ensete ventricosum]